MILMNRVGFLWAAQRVEVYNDIVTSRNWHFHLSAACSSWVDLSAQCRWCLENWWEASETFNENSCVRFACSSHVIDSVDLESLHLSKWAAIWAQRCDAEMLNACISNRKLHHWPNCSIWSRREYCCTNSPYWVSLFSVLRCANSSETLDTFDAHAIA